MSRPRTLVTSRTITKAAIVMMRPIRPLVMRVVAIWTFLGSPELIIYPQPAITKLAKKIRPTIMKTKFNKLKPPSEKRSVIFEVRGMLGAGLGRSEILTSAAKIWFVRVIIFMITPGYPGC
ncbi:MAG: hypothetical protein UV32_C0007G0002 [Candidatus Collierbacteria bacterium GW2011_GWF2_42_51]|nr:MAG: hypothetical protein UV32_C0007G0002 [Candidatus Collierbacteria bacterium GW2011_GWF2_42_51]